MPLKINGHKISWSAIGTVLVAAMWLGGLSFQVLANSDDVKEQKETKERLAIIETTIPAMKEDISEIKVEQKEQGKLLLKILEKVSEKQDE